MERDPARTSLCGRSRARDADASREISRSPLRFSPAPGSRRQYIHVLLRERGDPSPRPFGPFPSLTAMLGTANGAGRACC
jgi:hypothetical protein